MRGNHRAVKRAYGTPIYIHGNHNDAYHIGPIYSRAFITITIMHGVDIGASIDCYESPGHAGSNGGLRKLMSRQV